MPARSGGLDSDALRPAGASSRSRSALVGHLAWRRIGALIVGGEIEVEARLSGLLVILQDHPVDDDKPRCALDLPQQQAGPSAWTTQRKMNGVAQ